MLNEARQSVRNRFVVTGAPGRGKTPIQRELVRLGFRGVNEPAREILAEQRAIGGNGVYDKDPKSFCDLMLERAIADYERLGGAGEPAFFDRGIPDMVGYAEIGDVSRLANVLHPTSGADVSRGDAATVNAARG